MEFYYGVDPALKRMELNQSEVAKPFIEKVIAGADMALEAEEPALKMSEFLLTSQTGNRSIYEKKYFQRRRNCSSLMIAYWLTQDEKYLVPLIDYIMYICDEFTWCLPAHNGFPKAQSVFPERNAKQAVEWIDLMQAETARLFSEIVMCVGDQLPHYIIDRMTYEIRRRIFPTLVNSLKIDATEERTETIESYWWEASKTNWATVCGAGCMMAALYFGTNIEKEAYAKRFKGCLERYLEGIGDDGASLEGMMYWNYGFEHFVILAQSLKVYSKGQIDYFKDPKVKELALFPQRIRLTNTKVACFSDSNEIFKIKIGLISFLKALYSDVLLPEIELGDMRGNIDSVCQFLWFDVNYQSDKMHLQTHYFADAEWFISKRESYSFAAKAGYNDEAHNHNDIGSFMITIGEETFISDLGRGEYVKETFLPETRYTFLQNGSRGHSVPIISGEYQQEGKQYCSQNVKASDNSFEMEFETAYPKGLIERIHRSFLLTDNKITLTDTFEFGSKNVSIRERFIGRKEPKLCKGYVELGMGRIYYDVERYIPEVNVEVFHAQKGKENVYLIDFTPLSEEEKVFTFDFVVCFGKTEKGSAL